MVNSNIFPYLVAALELGAAIVYFKHNQVALGIAWASYAIAAVALGLA